MKVNEIFYSIQGEGYHTGKAAVFVRFSLCNLKCSFCDTDFSAFKEMSEEEIVDEIKQYGCKFVVFTGGEPTLQLTQSLVEKLRLEGYYIQIETNGTRKIDYTNNVWLTCSPKFEYNKKADLKLQVIDELKVVYLGQDMEIYKRYTKRVRHLYLQPCDTGDEEKNKLLTQKAVEFIKQNPRWRISLQTQKILNVQ